MSTHWMNRIAAAGLAAAVVSLASRSAQGQAQTGKPPVGAAADSAAMTKTNLHYRFRLLGVFDEATGAPLEGVDVSDMMTGAGSQTSKTGTLSLFFLPDGGGFVRIRKVGYEMQTVPVSISPTDTTPITIVLRTAQQLPTVSIKDSAPKFSSTRLQAVEARVNAHAGGYFITESDLRKWDQSDLANVMIAKLNGIHNTTGPHGETYFVSSRTACKNALGSCRTPDCYINVYVDGVKTYDVGASPASARPDFSRLSTQDYAIVEFYPGGASVPPEFGGTNASCGVLLLWTRER